MGGRLGLGGRLLAALLLAAAFLFVAAETGSADPVTYTVSIGAANPSSSPEGDGPGANSLNFPITVSPSAAPDDIAVTYTSSEGIVNAFTIPSGTASTTMAVPINGNQTAEDDRTMSVTLTGVAFATDTTDSLAIGSATAQGQIIDDDWRIAGLASDPANATVSEASGTIDFQISLANGQVAPANHAITVDYALADGTGDGGAVFNKNYKVTSPSAGKKSDTLTFAPGSSTVDVKVQGINDNVYGYDKTFTMTISNPKGASFAAGANTSEAGTITESSSPPIIGLAGCGTVTGGGDAVFPLTTSYASPIPATVTWTTTDKTTVAGDYNGGTGTGTVAAGTRNGSITIHTNANAPSGDRVFNLAISNGQHTTILASASTATCTIHQPADVGTDKLPSLLLADPAPVAQPAQGGAPVPVTIKVTLNAPAIAPTTPSPVNVHWQTVAGTATSPADYSDANGDLHWDAGKFGAQTFTVNVNPWDGTSSGPEKFTITFQTTDAAYSGPTVVTVTIAPPTGTPVVSVAGASVSESAGSIPAVVTLTPAATGPVTVKYATSDVSAKAGTDYTAVSGTLSFAAGQSSKTVAVPVIDNNNPNDGNRSFTFTLSAPSGAMLGNASATMTIRNDDSAPPPTLGPGAGPAPNQVTPTQIKVAPKNAKHAVTVSMLTAQSTVDNRGYAHYKLKCSIPAVKRCAGTVLLQVRVPGKKPKGSKKPAPLKTVSVGSGKFTIAVGKSAQVKVKVTKMGLTLLRTYKRIQVKATITAKDQQNVKGVTAWFVTIAAPARQITIKTGK